MNRFLVYSGGTCLDEADALPELLDKLPKLSTLEPGAEAVVWRMDDEDRAHIALVVTDGEAAIEKDAALFAKLSRKNDRELSAKLLELANALRNVHAEAARFQRDDARLHRGGWQAIHTIRQDGQSVAILLEELACRIAGRE